MGASEVRRENRRYGVDEYGHADTARLCQTIMAIATLLGLLVFLVGVCAARVGARGLLVAIMILYYWLAWPIGAICCGVAVLGETLKRPSRTQGT